MARWLVHLSRCFLLLRVIPFGQASPVVDDDGFPGNRLDAHFGPLQDRSWNLGHVPARPVEDPLWRGPGNVGQIAGVAVDPLGRPVIFHRGDREWDYRTFNENAEYQEGHLGPIRTNTILTLDARTGNVVHARGNGTFYLPHGIHVDRFGNTWLTDVALHQVFKYDSSGALRLTLGERFVPGDDERHFCQPTAVATTSDGEVVVADGYCNSRIIVFDPDGKPRASFGRWLYLNVPHSLTILPNGDACVADRENERVVCLSVKPTGPSHATPPPYSIGRRPLGRVFGVASYGGEIYGVSGATYSSRHTRGFTADSRTGRLVDFWTPRSGTFTQPHAIAVCPNGTALYVSEIGPNRVWKFDLLRV